MAGELFTTVLAQEPDASPAASTPFTIWNDDVAGTNVTASVTARDGVTAYDPKTDANGLVVPFRGPDGWRKPLYLDMDAPYRFMIVSGTALNGLADDVAEVLTLGGIPATWASITDKPTTFTPSAHTHDSGQVSDATTIGRAILTAPDAQTVRALSGSGTGNGTSNLTLGTTATTAAAGNHAHAASGLTFSPTGTLTATNIQTAIEQAASTGGGASTSATYVWKYASGGYPAIPATKPTGTLIVQALGPIAPPVPSVPAWCGLGPTQAALKYDYVALS